MMNCLEHEVLKDIPGYKAILKSVLKSQIQNLVEQLARETEEETVLLSVSTSDGTLSHLGSVYGKDFLQDKDDIKFQFLTYCLKKKHLGAPGEQGSNGSKEKHSSIRQDVDRQNVNYNLDQVGLSEQTPNHAWEHSKQIVPVSSQENNSLQSNLKTNQDEFSNLSTGFSETLTVDGEKLVVQTNPINSNKRRRKRKPAYIPNSQRVTMEEVSDSIKVEAVESFLPDGSEPSSLEESEHLPSQADDMNVSIKTEPEEEIMENPATLPTNDSGLDNVNGTVYQPDIPLPKPDNSLTTSFGDKTSQQESLDGKLYFNLVNEVGKVPLNPADMYKAKYRKLLNIKLEDGDRPYKCPLCARCFKLRHHLQNHFSVHSGERLYDCDICGKSFMRRGTMQIHRRIHSRETPYQCERCFESFMRRDRLLYHKCPGRSMLDQEEVQDFPTDLSKASSISPEETTYVL